MFCTSCGKPAGPGEKFCSACGAPLPVESATPATPAEAPTSSRMISSFRPAPSLDSTPTPPPAAPTYNAPTPPPAAPTYSAPVTPGTPTYTAPTHSVPPYGAPTYGAPAPDGTPGRCLPSFIVGIIAGVFGICDGLCVAACSSMFGGEFAFFFIVIGSIVGLIGACMCFKDAKIGSILQLAAAISILICVFGITGGFPGSILAGLMFLVSAGVGFYYTYLRKS